MSGCVEYDPALPQPQYSIRFIQVFYVILCNSYSVVYFFCIFILCDSMLFIFLVFSPLRPAVRYVQPELSDWDSAPALSVGQWTGGRICRGRLTVTVEHELDVCQPSGPAFGCMFRPTTCQGVLYMTLHYRQFIAQSLYSCEYIHEYDGIWILVVFIFYNIHLYILCYSMQFIFYGIFRIPWIGIMNALFSVCTLYIIVVGVQNIL